MITQDRLKELFSYSPKTGKFKRFINDRIARTKQSAGYIQILIDGKLYLAHRLAFLYITGSMPDKCIDHINQIRDDNRWSNLRVVSHSENLRNARISKRNTSGKLGVSFNTKSNKWVAIGTQNGKRKFLGYFANFDDAVLAREEWDRIYCFENHGKS
jgi:hypothetical protein